jgi:two-component system sensor histidine kinase AtoS
MEALSDLPAGSEKNLEVSSFWDKANTQAVIRFKDNGPGINSKVQERVFDPFFSTKEKGSGIGLALCRDLILEHGGKIEVDGSAEGTVFTICLPCLVKTT